MLSRKQSDEVSPNMKYSIVAFEKRKQVNFAELVSFRDSKFVNKEAEVFTAEYGDSVANHENAVSFPISLCSLIREYVVHLLDSGVDFPNASESFCPTKKLRSVCRPVKYGSDFDEKGSGNTRYIWAILQKINLVLYLTGSIVDLKKLLSSIVLESIAFW
jgi:hypothetical protein